VKRPTKDTRITASELGLRDLPSAWRGATLEQMVNSARKVVEQSETIGGSQDPRLSAAIKILDFTDRLEREKSR
jgi:hypothetical protein